MALEGQDIVALRDLQEFLRSTKEMVIDIRNLRAAISRRVSIIDINS